MALVLADRVRDTTTTTSTGTITLSGTAPTGFQDFSVIGNGNTTYYTIAGQSTSEWEVGIGTYTSSGTTLSRTTVLGSSNAGSLVVFSAGTKDVFVTYPAERSVNLSSTALTSGRVPYATTDGLLVDAANLTFNGTTLTANTIGAFTLSGTVAGGGNQLNNVIIGTSTPLAGNFTTVSATTSVTTPSVTNAGTLALSATSTNIITASTNGSERLRLDTSGNALLGGTAARGTTVGAAHLDIFNGTAPAGTLTNGISLYSASGDFNFMDSSGNGYKVGFRNVPAVGTKTASYTLATTDLGKYVQVGTSGAIVIPDATFAEGDIISIFNNTSGNITITCSITTAYISGTDSDKATMTLATRGIATVFFISGTVCVVSGSVT